MLRTGRATGARMGVTRAAGCSGPPVRGAPSTGDQQVCFTAAGAPIPGFPRVLSGSTGLSALGLDTMVEKERGRVATPSAEMKVNNFPPNWGTI